jgi:CheY-like chemotaxis protein
MPEGGKLIIETANAAVDQDYAARHPEFAPGQYAMLCVTDTGCGMDPGIMDRIFDPFFTTKALGQGTGLGLSTVHGIVKQSGGHIWVYSEPGKGTSFKIHLPRAESGAAATPAHKGSTASSGGSETILVAEDESIVRGLMQRVLTDAGYTVIVAENAQDALLACERHASAVSLLVTDVVMPDMSGPELAERLKNLRPGLKVLFISGYTENSIVHHGVLDDGIHFLPKPFSVTGLLDKVRDVLNNPA